MVRTRQSAKKSPIKLTTVNKAKNKIIKKTHLEKLLSEMKPCRILLKRIPVVVSPGKVDVPKTLITGKQVLPKQIKKITFSDEIPIEKTMSKVSKTNLLKTNSKKLNTKNKSETSTSNRRNTKYVTDKEIVDIMAEPLKETIIENHVEDKQPEEQINSETNISKVQTNRIRLPRESKRIQEKTILKSKSSVPNTTKKIIQDYDYEKEDLDKLESIPETGVIEKSDKPIYERKKNLRSEEETEKYPIIKGLVPKEKLPENEKGVKFRIPQKEKPEKEKERIKLKTNKVVSPETNENQSDIYEFLSQSTSAELKNPIPDEVKKLVKEGKAKVAKRMRFKIKRLNKKKLKTSRQVWRDVLKNLSIDNNNISNDKMPNNKKQQSQIIKTNPSDNYRENDFEVVPNDITPKIHHKIPRKINSSNQNFSNLAKSVMMNETAHTFGNKNIPILTNSTPQRTQIENKQKLLQMARNFVNHQSTPNNNKKQRIGTENIFISPIKCMPPSPWRVRNENLPQTFHFSRSENHLPSYSSDVIRASQEIQENNEIEENFSVPESKLPSSLNLSNKLVPESKLPSSLNLSKKSVPELKLTSLNLSNKSVPESKLTSLNLSNKLDSKLSNLSNIENISPATRSHENIKQNQKEFDTITRKVLGARSPLKTINVLEVVHLPNWRTNNSKKNTILNILEKANLNETKISNSSTGFHGNNFDDKENTSNSINNLFGFNDSVEEQSPIKESLSNKKTLKAKLRNLRRLLPPKPTRMPHRPVRKIFESPPKQTDIRNVLTSTMSNDGASTKTNPQFEESTNISASSISEVEDENNSKDLHLFDDLDEPQTSFDTTIGRRTYGRFPKRKKHNFILFSHDSESDSETEKEQKIRKRTKHNKKLEIQHNKQLDEFANEFNSMCEEVEKYDLIIDN